MTAPEAEAGDARMSRWHRLGLQLLAAAGVALLSWLFYWLEYVPVARALTGTDATGLQLSAERPVGLVGVPAGRAMGFRLVGARRLDLTLPNGADMRSPELGPFLAKANRESEKLTGISCGQGQTFLKAQPGTHQSVSVIVSLVDGGAAAKTGRTLLLQRSDPAQFDHGLAISAHGARVRLTIDLNSSIAAPAAGTMLLCRSGRAATLGHAEFEVPADQLAVAQFLDAGAHDAGLSDVVFDFYSAGGTGLPAAAVAAGPLDIDGALAPQQIACAAGDREWLWDHFLPAVMASDCSAGGLTVTGLDLANDKLAMSGKSAFFEGLSDRDAAHFVSKAKENPMIWLLVSALITGTVIPWALARFKRRQAEPSPARSRSRSRRAKTK